MFSMIFAAIVCMAILWLVYHDTMELYSLSLDDDGRRYNFMLPYLILVLVVAYIPSLILSIFTLITLNKKSVKELYAPPSTALPSNEKI